MSAVRGRRLQEIDTRTGVLLLAGEVVVLLVLWQVLVGTFEVINPTFFPPPLDTLQGFKELFASDDLMEHVTTSLKAWTAGYALVLVFGIGLGLLIGTSLPVDKLAMPWVWTLYATPMLAYQPLAKAWFGFGTGPIIFLVFIGSVFPLLFNTAAGIRTVSASRRPPGGAGRGLPIGGSAGRRRRASARRRPMPFAETGGGRRNHQARRREAHHRGHR